MRNLPKLSVFQWSGMMVVLFLGTLALMQFPLRAQVDSKQPAEEKSGTEQNATQPEDETDKATQSEATDSEAETQITPAPEAKKLFESAREKLANRMYRAKIEQKLSFPNRTIHAKGEILRGTKYQMRLEFEVKSGGTTGKLLQVSNGDKLWTERKVNNVTKLTVQDVKEILSKVGANPGPDNLVVAEMGLGGITSLLASLDRTMDFGKPQSVVIDGEELFRVDGQFNKKFKDRIMETAKVAKGLPDYIPDGARVYFDRDDFPRRIQYLKEEPDHDVLKPIVTLDFLDVEWLTEADVKPSAFAYEPPERVFPEDVTKSYVDQIQSPPPGSAPNQ